MATLTTSYQQLAQKYLGNSYGDLYVRIYAKYLEQDIANNKTKVQYQARAYFSGSWIKDNQGSGSVSGTSATTKTGACTYPQNGETVIATTDTVWVAHGDDGKKSITASASLNFPNWGWSGTASGTADLPTIPRQAKLLTAPNFSDGDNPTITYSNPAGNAVSNLQACIAIGWDVLIPYREINKLGSSYTFSLTDDEREILLNACTENTLEVNFFVTTVIGGTYYYSSLARTFSVDNANPIITATVEDVNEDTIALTGDKNKLIKYYSNAKAVMNAEAQKGAAVDESLYIIRNGDNSAYTTSCIFEEVESNQFTFSAEDSRGNIGTASIELPMVDYTKLTCNIADNRPDALGNVNVVCSGNYFNGNFGAANNELTVQYRYGLTGGSFSDWADMSVTITGNSYTAYADLDIPNFVQTQFYSFETRAIDLLDTVTSTESSVKSLPIFHWGENDFVFEVPVTFNGGINNNGASGISDDGDQTVNGNMNITGNLRLKGTGNYGNHLLFGDSNYCYIAELTDDVMTIRAKKIYLDASSGVYVDDYAIPILDEGIWTPSLSSSAISSYTTQYGWYSKMGQSVTVGFYIKATCKSGYNSTAISISGLPFTPMYAAAGGGMCSGAYVAANQNFQCYVAETNKTITTRTQASNNTSSTNLTTSASGCWYRSSGGEITLSGTITFIANS